MLILPGRTALSDFRLNQFLLHIKNRVPAVSGLKAFHIHFVELESTLPESERKVLDALLDYGGPLPFDSPEGILFLVIPRFGTLSPWASKATDIAHNCGLARIKRIERGTAYYVQGCELSDSEWDLIASCVHDRMTQVVIQEMEQAEGLFCAGAPAELLTLDLGTDPHAVLKHANQEMGLALSSDEIDYLAVNYSGLGRNPTNVELMMFAQANSEHCRHKIFNANWSIDNVTQDKSLFGMIRNTYQHAPKGILSAYHDNAAVIQGSRASWFLPDAQGCYTRNEGEVQILIKVETHNHPTAISPFPGAATGSGGEIRDEGATGRGGKPKAGLCGFSVSNLQIPGFEQPWETDYGKPERIVSALDIMLEGPIGSAAFNNEFGRPNLLGYFRTFEEKVPGPAGVDVRGYHKPIMVAGGLGNIRSEHIKKRDIPPVTPIVLLGGPAMLIGLGGGAASSMASGVSKEKLDYASVQRGNPEMERRCQEVINQCIALGDRNPILSVHDVGAGGLSNAVPEIVHDAGRGGRFELRTIPNEEPSMSPLEIWCNEAQERYVFAVQAERMEEFARLCERERCPCAIIGEAVEAQDLVVGDGYFDNTPVDIPLEVLLGKPPKMLREVHHRSFHKTPFETESLDIEDAVKRVLKLPSVAAKTFLITIGDRTVGGLVARDQMVGPWQVPVADVAVTCSAYRGYTGEAMAMGERAPVAIIDAPASARLAIGEALTNIAAAPIRDINEIKLSANWMAAAGYPGEDAALFDTVRAVGERLCPALGIAIPVGKDSMSMRTAWEEAGQSKSVTAPLSLIISAFASVTDVRHTLTPVLRYDVGDSDLILVDLGKGRNRLGGSAFAQVYKQMGHEAPDLDDPQVLKAFFTTIQTLNSDGLLLAYHDRADGGLFVTVCEMAFAGHAGVEIALDELGSEPMAALFNEELGALIQVRHADTDQVMRSLEIAGLAHHSFVIGRLTENDRVAFKTHTQDFFSADRSELHRQWLETSYRIQTLRDNPDCARQEFEFTIRSGDPGMTVHVGFALDDDIAAPYIATGIRPRVAILREQGVNGQFEMAAAFDRAGFAAIDVHMSDIINGNVTLEQFKGIAACGGFSYGDVLGAGGGWAQSILFNERAKDQFKQFFERDAVFGLGVCNGCQMLSQLWDMIPKTGCAPRFLRNTSEQFEARLSLVEVLPSPSILLQGMQGSILPIAVAHGEGRAVFEGNTPTAVMNAGLVCMRFVDNQGKPTEHYPQNPNGSTLGITGITSIDGRFTIMMPHPERVFRTVQYSWHPQEWGEEGAWLRMFRNARVWLG